MIDSRGAMPRTGAIPDLRYPFGPGWAAYRLPCPGANEFVTAREAGIGFDGEPAPAGDPPAGGDPPKPPTPPADPPKPPATGADADADGTPGPELLAALRKERQRATDAEKALNDLRASHATDDEKREASIKAAAAQERDEHWAGRIRQSEVRSALRAAGLTNDKALALAVNAPEFATLKVDAEAGTVAELDKTIEKFKADYGSMFEASKPGGQPTRGPQNGSGGEKPKTLQDAVAAHYAGTASG